MSSSQSKQQALRWMVFFRWVVLLSAVLLVLILEQDKPSLPFEGVWAVLLAVGFYNLVLHLLVRAQRLAGVLTFLGFLLDGLLLSWGVAVTGGPLSSYIPFYLIIIMTACLVSSPRMAVFTAAIQWGLFLSTLWFCYDNHVPSDFAPIHSNYFYGVMEAGDPALRRGIYLAQGIRWSFFFILTTLVCGMLVRQVWNREERLRARERGLEQKRRLIQMGELTGRIAHGVNTPLGLISGNLEMLINETRRGSRTQKTLLQIEQYVQRAIRTVRDILDFSRQSLSEIKPVDVPRIVQAVVAAAQPKLKARGGKLILDVDPKLPPLMAYPEGLFQVLLNLVENAADSIDSSGLITLSAHFQYRPMRLSAADRRGDIRIVVRDTGKGIAPAHQKLIFEPFYSTKGFGKGTGLGLAIVKRIVDEHRGEIRVESRVGEGTVFTLLFPTDGLAAEGTDNPGTFYYNSKS